VSEDVSYRHFTAESRLILSAIFGVQTCTETRFLFCCILPVSFQQCSILNLIYMLRLPEGHVAVA